MVVTLIIVVGVFVAVGVRALSGRWDDRDERWLWDDRSGGWRRWSDRRGWLDPYDRRHDRRSGWYDGHRYRAGRYGPGRDGFDRQNDAAAGLGLGCFVVFGLLFVLLGSCGGLFG